MCPRGDGINLVAGGPNQVHSDRKLLRRLYLSDRYSEIGLVISAAHLAEYETSMIYLTRLEVLMNLTDIRRYDGSGDRPDCHWNFNALTEVIYLRTLYSHLKIQITFIIDEDMLFPESILKHIQKYLYGRDIQIHSKKRPLIKKLSVRTPGIMDASLFQAS